ncbi:uncharacterized protein J4E84_010046 [Alternaria hordeiaustralica]|uniref:uncharacterized protein n=1 Tax=Alternaria hordeiaustralica TaxID=1187925 RepID=UPI0020C51372|nr:uncharacterized protein J4E84_010046 [Alternaria hordeiaustralica]KAI4675451.1 hypothetical protein J4E84_010046 [Alternaria hordeiaustralica]
MPAATPTAATPTAKQPAICDPCRALSVQTPLLQRKDTCLHVANLQRYHCWIYEEALAVALERQRQILAVYSDHNHPDNVKITAAIAFIGDHLLKVPALRLVLWTDVRNTLATKYDLEA